MINAVAAEIGGGPFSLILRPVMMIDARSF